MTQLRPGPSNALPNELSRRIAQEIYDRILENYSTSRVVLFKCSIVCRAWLQTCRYHLFAVVTFRADLLEFISSSHVADSIVPFIRTVIVKGTRIKTQIEAEQAISLLLALENLSQLRLQSCDWGNLGFSTTWPSYDALFDRLTHFHLQSVHFYSPFALISVVRHMHMLQHLTLDNITWDRDGLHSEHSLASHSRCWPGLLPIPIHLTTLNIAFSLSSPILSWLLSQTAHALSLQTVILSDIQPREISLVGQFLRTVGLNLTQLELGFVLHNHNATITQDVLNSIDLSCNTNLCSLVIHQVVLYQLPFHTATLSDAFSSSSPYFWLSTLFSTLHSRNLTQITVHTWFSAEMQLDLIDWRALGKIFSRPNLSNLQKLQFVVSGIGDDLVLVRDWIKNRLNVDLDNLNLEVRHQM